MADAPDLGSGVERRASSSLALGTTFHLHLGPPVAALTEERRYIQNNCETKRGEISMRIGKTLGAVGVFLTAVLILGTQEVQAQRAELNWEGRIDDRAELVIRGRSVRVRTISGQRNGQGSAYWSRTLRGNWRPGRANVNKREGRGRVRIVQQPTRSNNYTTIIRIEDLRGGSDNYRVRVRWN